MADKTGSTGDSSGSASSCGSMLFVKPVASRIRPRLVSPYMTMNNEFYKSIHSEISRIADERGALVSVRDPELDEKGRASRSMILRSKSKCDCD